MSNVSLSNLTKHYGTVTAVDRISAEIAEGEFFSMLGPSGCGKSTTLRMIAGFEDITAGEIALDGLDVSGLPPEKRDIGFVFQNYAIFPHMNVFDNIAFGLHLRGVSDADIKAKVAAALEQVGMTGLETRMQSEMSGGQQQRVALARVLVTEPKILLLDEPLSALDKNLREEMKFWIKDLQTSLGITTIYVTHDQAEALTMSDRIAVMNDGKIAQIGTPREIYETPDNMFVAEFIGESSVLSGTVGDSGHEGELCSLEIGQAKIRARAHPAVKPGDAANIVLRPEHIQIATAPPSEHFNTLPATINSVIYQGATIRYGLKVGGQTVISETSNRPDIPALNTGSSVDIMWHVSSTRVLPAGS